ncbi:MAG: metallophosphatase family protein [Xanthomonadales bacterium]|nr:metallophosphatase family protein [Xanthomonadales bacterium]
MSTAANVTVYPSLAGKSVYTSARLEALLSQPQPVARGTAFTGRNATQVFSDEQDVVKIRSDISLKPSEVDHWVQTRIEREKSLGIYHPEKTWFIVTSSTGIKVGNVAPRLCALHQLKEQRWNDEAASIMEQFAHLYFRAVKLDGYRLDDGLSNFGLDKQSKLYYLDDDLYRWDDGVALAYAFSVMVRSHQWMNLDTVVSIGEKIGIACLLETGSRQFIALLTRQLLSLFLPRDADQQILDQLAQGLSLSLSKEIKAEAKPTQSALESRKIAVIGDIHANEAALRAVLDDIDRQGIEQILVVGDIVGYGPEPESCVQLLMERGDNLLAICGNHDYVCAGGDLPRGFSPDARWVTDWSRERMSEEALTWLKELPKVHKQNEWMAVHGAPIDKHYFFAYVYMMTYEKNLQYLADTDIRFCFHGHSHIPGVFFENGSDEYFSDSEHQSLKKYQQALICPGSVGQPRNGKHGAEYAVVDLDNMDLELKRLDYDLEPLLNTMRKNGFPVRLITRLLQGR